MSGLRRLSDTALAGGMAGATAGQVPVYNSATGHAAPGTPLFDRPTSVYNANAVNLRRARAAFARARSGGNNVRINCYGDSEAAGSSGTDTLQYANCYPQKLADLIASHGGLPNRSAVPYMHASLFGNPAASSFTGGSAGENRVVFSAGGASLVGGGILGTASYITSTSGATLTVGPIACDQIVLDIYQRATYGDPAGLPVTLDGVAQTNITAQAGTSAFGRVTYSPAQGTHTLVVTAGATAGKYGFFIGAKVRTGGATGGVEVARIARGGAMASDLLNAADGDNAATSSLNCSITQQPCDLAIIGFGINEMQQGTSQATFQANLTSIIAAVAAGGGDSILLIESPPFSSVTGFANWLNFVASAYAVADAQNVPLIDLNDRWTSYAVSNASPYLLYSDTLHPSKAGYADIAATVFGALNRVGVGI